MILGAELAGRLITAGLRLAGAAVVLAGASLLLFVTVPTLPLSQAASRFLPLPDVNAATALRASLAARSAQDGDLATAERESLLELSSAPFRSAAYVRLAYIAEMKGGGAWNAQIADRLAASYRVAGFDREAGLARIRLLFEHWDVIGPRWRSRTLAEHDVLWNYTGLKPQLRTNADTISNASGRLAAKLQISRLERADSAKVARDRLSLAGGKGAVRGVPGALCEKACR